MNIRQVRKLKNLAVGVLFSLRIAGQDLTQGLVQEAESFDEETRQLLKDGILHHKEAVTAFTELQRRMEGKMDAYTVASQELEL